MPAYSPQLGSVCTEPTGYWWVVCSSRLPNQYGAQSLLLLAQTRRGKDGFRMARNSMRPLLRNISLPSPEAENSLGLTPSSGVYADGYRKRVKEGGNWGKRSCFLVDCWVPSQFLAKVAPPCVYYGVCSWHIQPLPLNMLKPLSPTGNGGVKLTGCRLLFIPQVSCECKCKAKA